MGIPVVTHAHLGMAPNIYRYRSHRLESTILRTIGLGPIVVPAQHLADDLVAIEPTIAGSLHVIPNGVDTDLFHPRPRPLPSTPKRIVSLGHVNHNKNQEFLVDVADHLRSINTSSFEFVLYGPEDGEYRAQLDEKIRARGLENCFSFGGVTTEPKEVLHEAWAYVNCSVVETTPLSVLEALASGLPVFGTPNAGNREILEGAAAGYLSASPWEMAQDIAMLESSGAYEDVSRSARRLAEERYSEYVFVERFHDLLLSVDARATAQEDFPAALLLGAWATDLLARRSQPDLMRIGVLVEDREHISVELLADEALGFLERQGKVSWVFIEGGETSTVADTCDLLLIIRLADTRALRLAQHFTMAGKPVVFETDDNHFALRQSASAIEHVTSQNQVLEELATISDAVIVYSAESLRAFSPFNSNPQLLPTFQLDEPEKPHTSRDDRQKAGEDVTEHLPIEAHATAKFDVLSASLTRAYERNLALQATESHRGNHAAPQSRSIPIPAPYVERDFEWPGETATLFVSLDLPLGTGQQVILEVVLNDDIIVHRLVDLPSKPIPVHSPMLLAPGVVSVRLASVSEDRPTMITESQVAQLETVIRVFGPMESLHKPHGANIARRFVHFLRKRIKRA
jgi:hypothetical protein